jgi:hypothetical protein
MTGQLHPVEAGDLLKQRSNSTPFAQHCHGFGKPHLVIQLGESNHVAAARAAITVKQVPARVGQKAWAVIGVQGTQPHESTAADAPGWTPAVRLQVIQQRNLLFQFLDRHSIHELSTSRGSIRRTALQSQARMVAGPKKFQLAARHRLVDSNSQR